MRKAYLIIFIICVFVITIGHKAEAYIIETQDRHAYSGKDGIMSKEIPIKGIFEVNEEEGYIYEVSTVGKIDGQAIDLAKYNPVKWKIISSEDGNIIATRIVDKSENILVFRHNGTYYLFQAYHDTPLPNGEIMPFFSSFFYGDYEKK